MRKWLFHLKERAATWLERSHYWLEAADLNHVSTISKIYFYALSKDPK